MDLKERDEKLRKMRKNRRILTPLIESSDTKLEFEKEILCSLRERNQSERGFLYCSKTLLQEVKTAISTAVITENYPVGTITWALSRGILWLIKIKYN